MSRGIKSGALPESGSPESLEDLVYRPSLLAGNKAIGKGSPWVTIPLTCVAVLLFGLGAWQLAAFTKVVPKIEPKTQAILLSDQMPDDIPMAPAPPPPPGTGASVPLPGPIPKEKPPTLPPTPSKPVPETAPEIIPTALPTQDLSQTNPARGSQIGDGSGSGVPGGTGTGPGVLGGTGSGAGSGPKIVDVSFTQLKVKFRPPEPPYPRMAKEARIQGTVVVELVIDTKGVPVSAQAIRGPMPLRQASEAHALQWRFEPAMENGAPVSGRFTINVAFKLN